MTGRSRHGRIYVGVGGWTYEPWRGLFYPPDLPQKRELAFAAERLTSIEINGTYYSTFKPETFRKWAEETPDGFVFAVKASRYCTNRRVLAEAGESVARFTGQGLTELGDKLGPVLWQFAPTKKFDPEDFAAFLELLPREADGRPLRHVVEVRHQSFVAPAFVELLRRRDVAVVFTDHESFPSIPDVTADFVYARLQRARADVETGYPDAELDRWAAAARAWAEGGAPDDLPAVSPEKPPARPRDAFIYFISGAKERNPAAAQALLARL